MTRDKPAIRERVWKLLERRRVGRFPFPLAGRIPNFRGAEAAAARAATLPEWKRARRLKCNPDAPQRPLRLRALAEGKTVFMAVPRLRRERCFLRLDLHTPVAAIPALIHPGSADRRPLSMAICYPRFEGQQAPAQQD